METGQTAASGFPSGAGSAGPALTSQALGATLARARVLVVDDERSVVDLLVDCLAIAGYERVGVTSPTEALELLRSQSFDAMLCDLMMPGMTGVELMVKARLEAPDMAILVITAVADVDAAVRAMRVGAYDYIEKPVSPGDVALRVASALEARRDILESRRAQERLSRNYEDLQQLSAVKDNLVHMLVHDLKTPLTSAMGYMELLESRAEGSFSERQLRYLQQAHGSCRDMLRMTTTMLDLARLEHGALELRRLPTDLHALLRDAVAEIEPLLLSFGSQATLDCAPATPQALCDAEIVHRILANLLSNAAKHSPPGSTVRVSARPTGEGLITVSVADEGEGIAPADQARIFEKFQQLEADAAAGGAGIGLAFCKLAVEAHGGSIWVESQPGEGSTFRFSLPIATASTGALE